MNSAADFRETTRLLGVLRLEVEVRNRTISIRFHPGRESVRLRIHEIADAQVATYSAREHGGWRWGVRHSMAGDTTVYRLRGNHGVALRLADGHRIFLGSHRPSELRDAIMRGSDPRSR